MVATQDAVAWRGSAAFRYAALVYAVALVVHTADHLRRGVDAITPQVFWLGMVGTVVAVAAIGMVLARHPQAPHVAIAAGFVHAVGIALVHFGPSMGPFSDPLLGAGADALSVAAAALEVVGAAAAGVAGAYVLGGRA